MATADPLYSAGARLERASHRDAIQSRIRKCEKRGDTKGAEALRSLLKFNTTRRARYDKKPGGLGK